MLNVKQRRVKVERERREIEKWCTERERESRVCIVASDWCLKMCGSYSLQGACLTLLSEPPSTHYSSHSVSLSKINFRYDNICHFHPTQLDRERNRCHWWWVIWRYSGEPRMIFFFFFLTFIGLLNLWWSLSWMWDEEI